MQDSCIVATLGFAGDSHATFVSQCMMVLTSYSLDCPSNFVMLLLFDQEESFQFAYLLSNLHKLQVAEPR